jgi:hypothetical protein
MEGRTGSRSSAAWCRRGSSFRSCPARERCRWGGQARLPCRCFDHQRQAQRGAPRRMGGLLRLTLAMGPGDECGASDRARPNFASISRLCKSRDLLHRSGSDFALHRTPDMIGERIDAGKDAIGRSKERPSQATGCGTGSAARAFRQVRDTGLAT